MWRGRTFGDLHRFERAGNRPLPEVVGGNATSIPDLVSMERSEGGSAQKVRIDLILKCLAGR